ncbi:MAG: hypothetical protein AAGG75_13360 [Bacteroidota bacterium]
MPPLDAILKYQNQAVIQRFITHHPEAAADAELIFDDLKRFLWLNVKLGEEGQRGQPVPDLSFSKSMTIIDEMWHEFILLTEYYAQFCQDWLGQFVHHPTPMPRFEAHRQTQTEEACMEIFLSELITCVYEHFGQEVAERWFDYYEKYELD